MGMSSYILDCEDKFIDVEVPEIIKNSDSLQEAQFKAEERRAIHFNYITSSVLNEKVQEMWNEYWSKYNV